MSVPAKLADGVRSVLAGAADLLLPGVCAACAARDTAAEGLCDFCNRRLLSLVSLPYCPRCGTTVGPNIPVREDGCSACPQPLFRFATVIRLGPYTDPLRTTIRQLKYHRFESMRSRLGRMLAQATAARAGPLPIDVVVPVPMHWLRRLGRGYDHSGVLADQIARRLGVPMAGELVRTRHTVAQFHLSRSRRIENVRGAFTAARRAALEGAHVLLVDDVTTTGATANEAARTLLSGGASRVTLVVIAKSEPPTAYAQRLA